MRYENGGVYCIGGVYCKGASKWKPEAGAYVATKPIVVWKRVMQMRHFFPFINNDSRFAKLIIPVGARFIVPTAVYNRHARNSLKFRCSKAKVIQILNAKRGAKYIPYYKHRTTRMIYKIGRMMKPDGLTTDVHESCGHGIHVLPSLKAAKKFRL